MKESITKISKVDGVPNPRASYSVYSRIGNHIFLAGQVAMNPDTGKIPKSFADQCKLVLDNINTILISAGTSMDNILKTTVFLTDRAYHSEFDEIYKGHFQNGFPARSTIVAKLMHEDFLVEIEAIAWVPD
jgi:2-iminobutanoate/2-iminopropanoate deaminase